MEGCSIAKKIKNLKETHDLTDDMLQQQISDDHILNLKDFITWKEVGIHLPEIERLDIDDIDKDGTDENDKRRKLIDEWVERNAEAATYEAMITAMLKARKVNSATKLCKILKHSELDVPINLE